MIFALDIPDLQGSHSFPGQFVHALLGPQCPTYAGQAMLTSYVRFVEAACNQYRMGQLSARTFVGQSQNLSGFFDASSAFETCIGYMHRAARCMTAIRSRPEVSAASLALFPVRPAFMAGAVQNAIRDVRDAVQHSYQQVFSGSLAEGTPFMLGLAGTELPTPMPGEPQQTTKTWDSVAIGNHRISFSDMALWLDQMAAAAGLIVAYRPPSP